MNRKIRVTLALVLALSISACSSEQPAHSISSQESKVEATQSETTTEIETTIETEETTTTTTTALPLPAVEVYEAERFEGKEMIAGVYYGVYSVPCITIDGLDTTEVNEAMLEYAHSLDGTWLVCCDFSYWIGDEYISIRIHGWGEVGGEHKDEVFNVSRTTGKEVSKDEFIESMGLSSADFNLLVSNVITDAMNDDTYGIFDADSYINYKEENLNAERIEKAVPYISERGTLCFVYEICLHYGGSQYYFGFDTETHEHYDYEKGQWCLFS